MCCETDMLRVSGILCVILYPKNMWYYITYDGPTKLQKTWGWSPTPFPRCTLGSSEPNQRSGPSDQTRSRYIQIYSSQIFTYMLFKYIGIYSQNYSPPGCVPSVWPKVSFRTDDPRLGQICSHDHFRISKFWAPKWSELGHTTKNSKNSFIGALYDHKQCTYSN